MYCLTLSNWSVSVAVCAAWWHWWSNRTVVLPRSFCRYLRRWHRWQQQSWRSSLPFHIEPTCPMSSPRNKPQQSWLFHLSETFNASSLTSHVKWTEDVERWPYGRVVFWSVLRTSNWLCWGQQLLFKMFMLHLSPNCCWTVLITYTHTDIYTGRVYDTSLYVLWTCANESLADVWKPVSVPALFIYVNLFVVSSEHFVRMDVVTCTSELRFSYRRVCWHSANSSVRVA